MNTVRDASFSTLNSSTFGPAPQNMSVFNPVSPYNILTTGGIAQSQQGHSKIANSLKGLFINQEALLTDATTRSAEPFVGARTGFGTYTQDVANYDLSDAVNKYAGDEYYWRSNPVAAPSAQNFGAVHRNDYSYYSGIGSDPMNGNGNGFPMGKSGKVGLTDAHRTSQRADPILEDYWPKRQSHPTRSVYAMQFNDYNGFDLDRAKDVERPREFYLDEEIAKKYARERVANVSSSHHAFWYRDPYETKWHQPYVEANIWLDLPNV